MTDKGRKGQHDDVVGCKHGQHRHQPIQQKEQHPLTPAGTPQDADCQQAEKAQLVKIHRHHGHGEEQHQYLERIDLTRAGQPLGYFAGADLPGQNHAQRPRQRRRPENAHPSAPHGHRRFAEHQQEQSATAQQKDDKNSRHALTSSPQRPDVGCGKPTARRTAVPGTPAPEAVRTGRYPPPFCPPATVRRYSRNPLPTPAKQTLRSRRRGTHGWTD